MQQPTEKLGFIARQKAKVAGHMDQALAQVLEPGEKVEARAYAVTMPSNWWYLLTYFVMLLAKYWFVAVTDRRVIFIKVSKTGTSRSEFAWADPRPGMGAGELKKSLGWTKLDIFKPDGGRMTLSFDRNWRDEAAAIQEALRRSGGPLTA